MKRAFFLILTVVLFSPDISAQQAEPRADRLTEMLKTDVCSQSDLITFGWNHQATRLISFQVNLLALLDDDTDEAQMGLSAVMQFQF